MAWTRPISGTVTAEAANEDLELRFYFSDGAATPPNALRARLSIKHDGPGGPERIDALLTATSLSAAQRTTLLGLLAQIRDDGLTALGYTKS